MVKITCDACGATIIKTPSIKEQDRTYQVDYVSNIGTDGFIYDICNDCKKVLKDINKKSVTKLTRDNELMKFLEA